MTPTFPAIARGSRRAGLPRPTPAVLGLALCLWAMTPRPAGAQRQTIEVPVPRPMPTVVERADRLLDAGNVRGSLDLLEARLAADPADFESRWRAARAALYLGILATGTNVETTWYRRAMAHADTALAERPNDVNALRWAVAAKGSLAELTGAQETVGLANEVWTLVHRLLDIDPNDALGHDTLGSLNYRVMILSSFKRTLGRIFMGGEILSAANWPDALKHHRRAVELEPGNILYRVDLANTLARLGHRDEALAQLEIAVSLPERLPVDGEFRDRAERRLAELRRLERERRSSTLTLHCSKARVLARKARSGHMPSPRCSWLHAASGDSAAPRPPGSTRQASA